MLDKKSKQVLKALNKAVNDVSYVNGSGLLLKYLPKKYNRKIVDDTLLYLADKGYVQNYPGDGTITNIYVEYKAKNYKEFNRLALKSFLIKSIVVPLLVSFFTAIITAAITIWITNHFKK